MRLQPKVRTPSTHLALLPPSARTLAVFPHELVTMIIKNLNIRSLRALEYTNKIARDFITSVRPVFANVHGQAPQTLAAAVALDVPYSTEFLHKML